MAKIDVKDFGLKATRRIKAFVFKFISVPTKWVKTARQHVLNVYTDNRAYAGLFFRRDIAQGTLNPDTRIFFSWGTNELISNPGLEDRIREVEWLVQQKGASTYLFRNEGGDHCEASWQHEVPCWMHFLWE